MDIAGLAGIRRYSAGDRINVQAQRIWLILTGFVSGATRHNGDGRTITYGDLAKLMGYADARAGHMLGRQLGIVGNCCLQNDLPALNAIVVNAVTNAPGHDVVLSKGRTVAQEQKAVFRQDWYEVGVPTTGMLRTIWEQM
jgi:hypothetical protein